MVRGRFAPSPTGHLHFGSLIAAVASFLEVKTQAGDWLVRMEDLDKPREQAGAADHILRTLDAFGFEWYGEVVYQSQRSGLYQPALDQLADLTYPCTCSRREIADSAAHAMAYGIDGFIYPRTCLTHAPKAHVAAAWRLKTPDIFISFDDAIQGKISQNLSTSIGDFVLKRADGIFAYQLAVVVDDFMQGITHIVRGADLLDSTTRQIYLQNQLGYPTPTYAHLPIAVNTAGEKLSKQTLAEPLNTAKSSEQLFKALQFLGQNAPASMQTAPLKELWQWAFAHWTFRNIPTQRAIIST